MSSRVEEFVLSCWQAVSSSAVDQTETLYDAAMQAGELVAKIKEAYYIVSLKIFQTQKQFINAPLIYK